VQRRAPGEPVQAVIEPLEQREAAIVADPDQPFALLDLLPLGVGIDPLEQAHPRSARMFAA
jgi:hypothetical protein